MNCPADVTHASTPASSPGVPPGVRAGGETPPQLAGGTPALQGGSWKASESRIETINSRAHNAGQASRLSVKRPGASDSDQPTQPSEAGETPALRSGSCEGQGEDHEPSGEAPQWAIHYGKEFWRRGKKQSELKPNDPKSSTAMMPANVDLGDIIDRVSHAITKDGSSRVHRVRANTYTAAFDNEGMRFSPLRPGNGEPTRMNPQVGLRDKGRETVNETQSASTSSPFPHLHVGPSGEQEQNLLLRKCDYRKRPPSPRPSPPGEGEARTAPANSQARWCGAASWGLTSAATAQQFEERTMRTGYPLPNPDTEVILRTRSVRSGDRIVYEQCARPLSWSLRGNTAQTLLDERIGLVEHYEAGSEGVQVSWVLNQRLVAEGSLEIEFEMEGLRYAGTSDQGIHLADATGRARVRIGKAVAVDSAGRRSEAAIVANDRSLYVQLSSAILAQAIYPLAIDPLISPEFGMDEPVIVPRPGEHQIPAVAWNGTNWLVVWTEWPVFESPVDVVAARVSKEGGVLDQFGILISRGEPPPAAPSVASNGKDYFVVWEHFDFITGLDIYGARVTADGQVADQDGLGINDLPGDQFAPSVAGGSEGYMVVWQDTSNGVNIHGTRVSNDGVVLDGDGLPLSTALGNQTRPSVARGPGGFLVVWSDARGFSASGWDIYGTRLDMNGSVLDANGIAICTASNDQWSPRVAANSMGYLVVWQDSRSTGDIEQNDIYGTLVSSAGVVSHPQGIAVSTATGNQSWPAVAAGSEDFLVVWNDNRPIQPGIYGSRIGADGSVLDPEGVLVDPVPKTFFPAVAASDNGFFAVWMRSSRPDGGFGSGILGARLNRQAEVIDAQPILITLKDNDELSPAVASNGTNWLVVWQDWRNSDGINIYGTRISYEGMVLETEAVLISPRPGFVMEPAVASVGGDYLVVWTDGRSFPYDIYGASVRGDGTVMDRGGIPICTAPDFQFNPVVTSDGTNYLVVWQDARAVNASDIYGARVTRDGVVLEPNGFPISAGKYGHYTPTVAYNGTAYLVVWSQSVQRPEYDDDVYGARVSRDGVVLDPAGISISRATNAQRMPAVASSGSDFLVVWADTRNTVTNTYTFGGEIYGARVDSDGRVLDPDGFLISTMAFSAIPALASNGTDFLAVWASAGATPGPTRQIRAARLDRNRHVMLGDLTVNTTGSPSQISPAVAGGRSNSFLVVSEVLRNGATRVVGNLISLADTPTIQSLTLARDGATIAWSAEAGKTYLVQFKSDLSSTNWNELEPSVSATNTSASIFDSTVGHASQRFYRVFLMP